jgi:hypothetical protein
VPSVTYGSIQRSLLFDDRIPLKNPFLARIPMDAILLGGLIFGAFLVYELYSGEVPMRFFGSITETKDHSFTGFLS